MLLIMRAPHKGPGAIPGCWAHSVLRARDSAGPWGHQAQPCSLVCCAPRAAELEMRGPGTWRGCMASGTEGTA
jgi:hypothetical protein